MINQIEQTLFEDPQAAVPLCYCRRCGGARYAPGLVCIRCERKAP